MVGVLDGHGAPRFFVYDREENRSLLNFIVKKVKCQMSKVKGIVVVPGPGGFSTVRAVVVFANTAAFVQGILLGVTYRGDESQETLFKKGIALIQKGRGVRSVAPVYGKEPNITTKKLKS